MAAYSVTILCPNGRREVLKVTLNTSLLQILEDVCRKQGLKSEDHTLKHYNRILDLSNTVRYSNLANKAQLELVKSGRLHQENVVTIGLQLESGERLLKDFPPSSSLWEIVVHWEKERPEGNQDDVQPVCVYMRNEISGEENLRQTTLRSLGLTNGKAIIRLSHRAPDIVKEQAHFAPPLPKLVKITSIEAQDVALDISVKQAETNVTSPPAFLTTNSQDLDISSLLDNQKEFGKDLTMQVGPTVRNTTHEALTKSIERPSEISQPYIVRNPAKEPLAYLDGTSEMDVDDNRKPFASSGILPTDNMDASGTVGEPHQYVLKLGDRNAFLYSLDQVHKPPQDDLPDDFFNLTVQDVRFLMADLKRKREQLESVPLHTRAHREAELEAKISRYNHTNIRIQFPDRLVLQGTFETRETVADVIAFVRKYLNRSNAAFYLFSTPPKKILQPEDCLFKASLVPNALVHFGFDMDKGDMPEISDDIRRKLPSPSPYNSSCLNTNKNEPHPIISPSTIPPSLMAVASTSSMDSTMTQSGISSHQQQPPSASASSRVPKWFKQSK